MMSSTDLPRLAAMSAGVLIFDRPSRVARTRLYGFDEPVDLATTSVTPITSKIASIAPPAITPVPGLAGDIITYDAPWRPVTLWWSVPFLRGTLIRLRRASSIAFCTPTGTSFDLP